MLQEFLSRWFQQEYKEHEQITKQETERGFFDFVR